MKRLGILLLASVVGLTGCAGHEKKYGDTDVSIAPHHTTSWVLIDWRTPEGAQAILPSKGERPITLSFEPKRRGRNESTVRGFAGCNEIQGAYGETEHMLTVSTLRSSKNLCTPTVMKMEYAFVKNISTLPVQKSFRPSSQGRLMILTAREGDQWTFVEAPGAEDRAHLR